MTIDERARFESALLEWRVRPVTVNEDNPFLQYVSTGLVGVQESIAPTMIQLFETGEPLPTPVEHWHDGMTYIIVRETDSLRAHLRKGRNQVATRALIEDSARLQRAWNEFRKLVGV